MHRYSSGDDKDLTWLGDGTWTFKRTSAGCTCVADPTGTNYRFKDVNTEYVLSAWSTEHYRRVASLLGDRPCNDAIADEEFRDLALKEGSKCLLCREVVHDHMRLFTTYLKQDISLRIAAVSESQRNISQPSENPADDNMQISLSSKSVGLYAYLVFR